MSSKNRSRKGSSGPDAGDADLEVFPDLHHKMSKKIAQLTKVIYHLNTKNEDHQSMMEAISYQHKIELDAVAKDALSRMTSAKELAEIKQKLALKESSIEKLIKKHQAEKDKTVADFDKFKTTMSNKESQLQQEFEEKYEKLANDFERINKEFKNRINSFEKTNNHLKHELTEALASGGDAAIQLKKQHDQEMEKAIIEANSKYNDMLMEQLSKQEVLSRDYEDKLAALRRELEDAAKQCLQTALEKELGQLRALLNGEKETALLSLKREYEDRFNHMRDDLSNKLEKCISDLGIKKQAYTTLEKEKTELERLLLQQKEEMENKMANEMGSADQKLQNALIEAAQLKMQAVQLNATIQEHEENIRRLEDLMRSKNNDIMRLEDLIKEKDAELTALMERIACGDNTSQTLSETIKTLESQLKELLEAKDTLGKQVRESENALKNRHNDVKQLTTRVHELETNLESLTSENTRLQARLDSLSENNNAASMALQQELSSLRAQLTLQENAFVEEKEALRVTHSQSMEELKQKALKDKQADQECITGLQSTITNTEKEMEKSRITHINEVKALQQTHEDALQDLNKKHLDEVSTLKMNITHLENEVQRLMEANDNNTASISKDLVKIQEKYKLLKTEYETKKREGEVAQSTITGLKQQIDDLREELKSTQRAYKEKMDMSLQKLEEVWLAKMETLASEHQIEKDKISGDLQSIWDQEKAALIDEKDGEIESLKKQLADETKVLQDRVYVLERDKVTVESELVREKDHRQQEVVNLTQKHEQVLEELDTQHRDALESLRKELLAASESSNTELLEQHNKALQDLRDHLAHVTAQSQKDMDAAITKTQKEGETLLATAVSTREQELHQDHSLKMQEVQDGHNNIVVSMKEEHQEVASTLQSQVDTLKESLRQKADQNTDLVSLLKTEKENRETDQQQHSQAVTDLGRENEMNLRQERENSQRALNDQQERFLSEMKLLKQEFAEDRQKFDTAMQDAKVEYAILEERYQNRESRPDDILRIQELETIITNQEEEVKRTREEMLYLKRELQNREESYNLKFNVKPNVGVMQVIKNPATDGKGVNPGGSSKTGSGKSGSMSSKMGGNKPRHVVGGNGGAMGMPGLGGIGGSMGGMVGNSKGGAPPLPGSSKQAPAPIPSGSRESGRMR